MKYHELVTDSKTNKKRVGRGISAGQGKTAGRGTKGQNSRTGKKLRATFMGGQRSLMQAIPKNKGFKSLRVPAQVVYLEQLEDFKAKKATNETLFEAGLIGSPFHAVKIITRGELTKAVAVEAQGASASAEAAIVKAGGSFVKVAVPLKVSAKPAKEEK
jgi:large subunit ribosomal protein L15